MRSLIRARPGNFGNNKSGFVLLFVLISIGVLSLIGVAIIQAAQEHSRLSDGLLRQLKVEQLADSGYNLAISELISSKLSSRPETLRFSVNIRVQCSMNESAVLIRIEDEAGKIDLNVASKELLHQLILGIGREVAIADSLSKNIIAYREAVEHRTKNDRPYNVRFLTIYQLLQVPGVDREFMEALAPYLTVYSRISGVDPSRAGTNIFGVLTLGASPVGSTDWGMLPSSFISAGVGDAFRIQILARSDEGAVFSREAVVEFQARRYDKPVLREWTSRSYDASRWEGATDIGPC